jgi:hypothetical protein
MWSSAARAAAISSLVNSSCTWVINLRYAATNICLSYSISCNTLSCSSSSGRRYSSFSESGSIRINSSERFRTNAFGCRRHVMILVMCNRKILTSIFLMRRSTDSKIMLFCVRVPPAAFPHRQTSNHNLAAGTYSFKDLQDRQHEECRASVCGHSKATSETAMPSVNDCHARGKIILRLEHRETPTKLEPMFERSHPVNLSQCRRKHISTLGHLVESQSQRRLAWPLLRKDDTHKSRSVNNL